jgi:hypothetical protein
MKSPDVSYTTIYLLTRAKTQIFMPRFAEFYGELQHSITLSTTVYYGNISFRRTSWNGLLENFNQVYHVSADGVGYYMRVTDRRVSMHLFRDNACEHHANRVKANAGCWSQAKLESTAPQDNDTWARSESSPNRSGPFRDLISFWSIWYIIAVSMRSVAPRNDERYRQHVDVILL